MKTSRPPALSTWMLEHLVLASDTKALAGDLLEEFNRHGSAGWFWRQVFAAMIVGLSRELGLQRKAATFAVVWIVIDAFMMRQLFQSATYQSLHPWSLRHQAPEAYFLFMGAGILLHVLIVWLGLVAYLALMGSLNAQRLTRGQLVSVLFIVLEFLVYRYCWGFVLNFFLPRFVPGNPAPELIIAALVLQRLPSFLALLASLCATLPSTAMKPIRTPFSRISD